MADEENGESGSHALGGRATHGSENEVVPIQTLSLNFSIGCPEEYRTFRQQRAAKPVGQPCLVAWNSHLKRCAFFITCNSFTAHQDGKSPLFRELSSRGAFSCDQTAVCCISVLGIVPFRDIPRDVRPDRHVTVSHLMLKLSWATRG